MVQNGVCQGDVEPQAGMQGDHVLFQRFPELHVTAEIQPVRLIDVLQHLVDQYIHLLGNDLALIHCRGAAQKGLAA